MVLITVALVATVSTTYASSAIGISINGKTIASDVSPIMENGRTLVPIRVISENLGAEVKYNEKTRTVTIIKDGITITLRLDKNEINVNGTIRYLDVPARAVKGRTMVPIRVISEVLRCKTVWDDNNKMVMITTKEVIEAKNTYTDVDPWGRKVRSTNLPEGAEYFPYICEDVPNWAYEEIVAYMKNTNGRAIWSGFGIDEFGTPYPEWDPSDKNTPKDFWNSRYSVEAYYDRVKKYLDFCVNIDYRTLTREQVAEVMKECLNPSSYKGEEVIDGWYNYYKNNKIIVSGDVIVIPEGFHLTETGRPVVTALVTFKVTSQAPSPNDYGNIGGDRKYEGFTIPHFETGKTYQGIFVNPTTWYAGDANNYQLSYNYTLFDIRDFRVID